MTDEYKSGIVLYNPVGCIWLVMRGGAVGGQTERQDMWWQAAEVQDSTTNAFFQYFYYVQAFRGGQWMDT